VLGRKTLTAGAGYCTEYFGCAQYKFLEVLIDWTFQLPKKITVIKLMIPKLASTTPANIKGSLFFFCSLFNFHQGLGKTAAKTGDVMSTAIITK